MKAALVTSPGASFVLTELSKPVPKAGEALVRIHAAGLNPLDHKIRAGQAPHAKQPLPAVLGLDLAGIVEAVGPGVTRVGVGDEVYGLVGGVGGHQGTLAEYIAVPAELLAKKPRGLTMREAASLPLAIITAWEGLVDRANVHAGQRVLVLGGQGGVGRIAVQIAKARGASVHLDDTEAKDFDVVFDTRGGASLDQAFRAIKRFGHVVSILGWGTHSLAPLSFQGGTYSGVFTLLPLITGEGGAHHGEILEAAAELDLVPHVDPRLFTLEEVNDAFEARGQGKIVVSCEA